MHFYIILRFITVSLKRINIKNYHIIKFLKEIKIGTVMIDFSFR